MNKIPDWLKLILDDSGWEQGRYSFSEEEVDIPGLPSEFVGIAEHETGGLAIAKNGDGVIYKSENGKIDVYAVNEQEFKFQIRRDDAWEELSENMPATKSFWLGIVLKTIDASGAEMTLGFKGSSRDSVMVIQGEMRTDEMLSDALTRELSTTMMVNDYEVMDVFDDGGMLEDKDGNVPMFTVVVKVEELELSNLEDERIGWINMEKPKAVN